MDQNLQQNVPQSSQPNLQTPLPITPQTKKHNVNKIISVVVAIIILFIVAGGAYYLGTKQQSRVSQASKEMVAVSPTQILTPTNNPTANWQTYTALPIGLIVKYPQGWTKEETPQSTEAISGATLRGTEGSIAIFWGQGAGGGCPQVNQKQVNFGGKMVLSCDTVDAKGNETWSLLKQSQGIPVSVMAIANNTQQGLANTKPLILSILSSIELDSVIPTPDPTANWQTYKNATYLFQVKYNGLDVKEENSGYFYVDFININGGSLPPFLISVIPDTFVAKDPASYNYMSADWINNIANIAVGQSKTMDQAASFVRLPDTTVAGKSAQVIEVTATGYKQHRVYVRNNGNIYMISNYYQNPDELNNFALFLSTFKFTQ